MTLLLLVAAAAVAAVAAAARGADVLIEVAPAGGDDSPTCGAADAPCASLKGAFAVASKHSDDVSDKLTIRLRGGQYALSAADGDAALTVKFAAGCTACGLVIEGVPPPAGARAAPTAFLDAAAVTPCRSIARVTIAAGSAAGGSVVLRNVQVKNAVCQGAAVMLHDQRAELVAAGAPRVTDCTFENNTNRAEPSPGWPPAAAGGGLALIVDATKDPADGGSPPPAGELSGARFERCQAPLGGGAFVSNVHVRDTTFTHNKASTRVGGGAHGGASGAAPGTAVNCVACGGGLYAQNPHAVFGADVTDCTFTSNEADQHGGGAAFDHLSASKANTVASSNFTSNKALGHGGGVFAQHSMLDVNDGTVFDKNHAGQSGGNIAAIDALATKLTKLTLTHGSAFALGGGVFVVGATRDGSQPPEPLPGATFELSQVTFVENRGEQFPNDLFCDTTRATFDSIANAKALCGHACRTAAGTCACGDGHCTALPKPPMLMPPNQGMSAAEWAMVIVFSLCLVGAGVSVLVVTNRRRMAASGVTRGLLGGDKRYERV